MHRCCCFLCASDEGVFLEVTPESVQAAFGGQIEACLSNKVNQIIQLSNKICYKCAYELDQCSKFLQKSKKSHDVGKPSRNRTVPHCSLCCESVESGHIFDITEDNRSVFSPLQKIRKIFSEELAKKVGKSKLVCLVCRYNLDVLYDLKKLHEQTVNNLEALIKKKLDYSGFPKVYTDVVNRKTTITTFPDSTVYGLISSDSESNDEMALGKQLSSRPRGRPRSKPHGRPSKKPRGRPPLNKNSNTAKSQSDVNPKSRSCDQCCNVVANDMDMYRFYCTGQTVCRKCWITMDPNKDKSKRYTSNSTADTKLCTVYLKDVLSKGPSNDDNADKEHKVKEEDKDTTLKTYIAEESSHDEEKSQSGSSQLKTKKPAFNGNNRQGSKRLAQSTTSDAESVPSKLSKMSVTVYKTRSAKALSDLDQPSTSFQRQNVRKRRVVSDSDSDSKAPIEKSKITRSKKSADQQTILSVPEEDDSNVRVSKKQKLAAKEVTKNVRSESESSNEGGGKNLKKKRMKAGLLSAADTKKTEIETRRETRRTRSSSISSKEMTPPVEFKSPTFVPPQEYICDKCGKKFDTKLAQMQHKLTHGNQFMLTLEKVNVPIYEEEEESIVDAQEDKTTSEEAEAGPSGIITSVDKIADGSNEEIDLRVDDDSDDVCLDKRLKSHEEENKEEEPDAEINESHDREDETTKTQDEEKGITSESQECADSAAVSDKTVTATEMNEENEATETLTKEHVDTSKDQDDHTQEDAVAVSENHRVSDDEKENEDEEMENDTEKTSFLEKEEPAAEFDKDIDDEMTPDNENTEHSVSTAKNNKENDIERNDIERNDIEHDDIEHDDIEHNDIEHNDMEHNDMEHNDIEHNEYHDESLESNLENNQPNDEDDKVKNAETTLLDCLDLTNDSREEDRKESEERKKITTDITDDITITLSDKEDSRDATTEYAEQQQNADVDEVVDIDTDKFDNNDTVQPNLTNCETFSEPENDEAEEEEPQEEEKQEKEEEGDDVVADATDSNDAVSVKAKKAAEKTGITDDSMMANGIPAESENDLEQLTNNSTECESQESNNKREVCVNSNNTSAATKTVDEVFDLAATEVRKRRSSNGTSTNLDEELEIETLENISREIRNSADMPSLDPINALAVNDDENIHIPALN